MPDQTAIVVSAVFAGFLAGVALTTVSGAARAGNDCLTEPKDQPLQGSHWYYPSRPLFSMVAHKAQLANKIAGAGDAEALPIRSIAYSRCEATHIRTRQASDIMALQAKIFRVT